MDADETRPKFGAQHMGRWELWVNSVAGMVPSQLLALVQLLLLFVARNFYSFDKRQFFVHGYVILRLLY